MQEPIIDLRDFVEFFQRHARVLIASYTANMRSSVQRLISFAAAPHPDNSASFFMRRVSQRDFRTADGLHQSLLKVRADGHHFAGSLHLCAQRALAHTQTYRTATSGTFTTT